jgi:hypothetical protein
MNALAEGIALAQNAISPIIDSNLWVGYTRSLFE